MPTRKAPIEFVPLQGGKLPIIPHPFDADMYFISTEHNLVSDTKKEIFAMIQNIIKNMDKLFKFQKIIITSRNGESLKDSVLAVGAADVYPKHIKAYTYYGIYSFTGILSNGQAITLQSFYKMIFDFSTIQVNVAQKQA